MISDSDQITLISTSICLSIKIEQVRYKKRCLSLQAMNKTLHFISLFQPNFQTQLSPNVPKQHRKRQRKKENKNYKDWKKRTNKQNSSWSPKALMKREFSSLSENFSPLQRLACISKVTASVCSFVYVCVCVLLLSCCLGCESGWRVFRGHKENVCVCTRMSVCACESEWTPAGLEQQPEPPKRTPGLSGRWRAGIASHLVL